MKPSSLAGFAFYRLIYLVIGANTAPINKSINARRPNRVCEF